MKHITTINLRKSKVIGSFSQNKFLIVFTILYAFGILLGVFLLKRNSAVFALAKASFSSFKLVRTTENFWNIFLSAVMSFLPTVLALFLSGTSVVGVALSPVIVCYCGFSYGITAGFLYTNYSLQGIAYNSLILLPCTFFALIGYFICAKSAFGFSLNIVRAILPEKRCEGIFDNFKGYCSRYALNLFIFVVPCLLDSILSVSFFKYFKF